VRTAASGSRGGTAPQRARAGPERGPRARREVQKAVRARKARCVVLAPNIEQDEDRAQLEAQLAELHGQALACDIPIVYALTRKKLGQARARARAVRQACGRDSGGVREAMRRGACARPCGRLEGAGQRRRRTRARRAGAAGVLERTG